jgi:hypothetical protein
MHTVTIRGRLLAGTALLLALPFSACAAQPGLAPNFPTLSPTATSASPSAWTATPEPPSPSPATEPAPPPPPPPPEEVFNWELPGGDLSVDAIGDVFNTLRAGRCEEAETDFEAFLVNDPVWTPGQQQLYRAAIAACSGDRDTAAAHLAAATLTRHPGDCRLYRAVVSFVEQRPQATVVCPAPETPPSTTDSATPDVTETPGTATAEPSG